MARNGLQAAAERLGFMAYALVMGGGRPDWSLLLEGDEDKRQQALELVPEARAVLEGDDEQTAAAEDERDTAGAAV